MSFGVGVKLRGLLAPTRESFADVFLELDE